MNKVTMYTKDYCFFCVRAKSILNSQNIKYDEINLNKNPQKKVEMIKKSNGKTTVPQIFVNDNYLGDCEYISKLHKNKELISTINKLGE